MNKETKQELIDQHEDTFHSDPVLDMGNAFIIAGVFIFLGIIITYFFKKK